MHHYKQLNATHVTTMGSSNWLQCEYSRLETVVHGTQNSPFIMYVTPQDVEVLYTIESVPSYQRIICLILIYLRSSLTKSIMIVETW